MASCRRRQGVASMFAMAVLLHLWVFASIPQSGGGGGADSTSIHVTNDCKYTIYPTVVSSAAESSVFELPRGESRTLLVPSVWAGRLWGCSAGDSYCHDYPSAAPVTIVEFSFNGSRGMDFYHISLVFGYNLPVLVEPQGGGGTTAVAPDAGRCTPTACMLDLDTDCPAELRVTSSSGATVSCNSACLAFGGAPNYCCTGAYGSPDTCSPSKYSHLLKKACPQATYAYDADMNGSVFTCGAGEEIAIYAVTFCPAASTASISGHTPAGNTASSASESSNNDKETLIIAKLGLAAAVVTLLGAILRLFKGCRS